MTDAKQEVRLVNTSGGKRNFGNKTFIYGGLNQFAIEGPYRGHTCTSMALSAIIVWVVKGYPNLLYKEDINAILEEGSILHSRLRLDYQLSSEADGMIGIYDLPSSWFLPVGEVHGVPARIKLAQESFLVFTSVRLDLDFPTIGQFIGAYKPGVPMGFLVTIECYSYAILRRYGHSIIIFDSHGHLRIRGRLIGDKAGILLCPDIPSMEAILVGMYGACAQCDIAPLEVDLPVPNQELRHIVEPDGVDEDSPYIRSFWGSD